MWEREEGNKEYDKEDETKEAENEKNTIGWRRSRAKNMKNNINNVQTKCIVKTSGFTRGVCKNRWFY